LTKNQSQISGKPENLVNEDRELS